MSRQASECRYGDFGAGLAARAAHFAEVGKREPLLRYKDKDGVSRHTCAEQMAQSADTDSRLSRPGNAFEEDLAINGRLCN